MILNGRMTNPGELRIPVTVLKRDISTGPGGFQVEQPGKVICLARVKWTNSHGAEAWQASLVSQQTATALMRYHKDIDETCYIRKGGVLWEIVSLDNIGERNEYLEAKVKRAAEG